MRRSSQSFARAYRLDTQVPNHSVLSKARARWAKEVFESLFVRTVSQCLEAGLVHGSKLHVDARPDDLLPQQPISYAAQDLFRQHAVKI
jgi:hypothetical protein